MSLDERIRDGDIVLEIKGIKIIYDRELDKLIKNGILDYSQKGEERGFYLRNLPFKSC